MARSFHSASNSDQYHASFPQSSAPVIDPRSLGRGRSPSGSYRPAIVHHERTSSTSVGQAVGSSAYRPHRPSQTSEDYNSLSGTARAGYATTGSDKKSLPPTPPRSSPSSPSPTRAQRSSPPGQVVPAYERCYTPPLDTRKKAPAMPGTMSSTQSKQNSPIKTRNRSGLGRRSGSPAPKSSKVSDFLNRMFGKKNVDNSDFVKIEDRHWSE
ncbi:hypothetical protein KVT40_008585 [Elsinoe batatas]|uniref:Uncharacterized protein n=1 Tax=Elsinoe batatas TaxID=2601811 RepID=A0A8K0PFJ0_9PEZI|nr:hypothetical protein KVT40_008585 [Elsinoe batatas]